MHIFLYPDLRGEEELLLLPNEGLKHVLLTHVVGAHAVAVDAQMGVALLQLPRFHLEKHCWLKKLFKQRGLYVALAARVSKHVRQLRNK